jgi:hypothetical protein
MEPLNGPLVVPTINKTTRGLVQQWRASMALHNVGPLCLAMHASQAVTGANTEKASS